LRQASQPHVAKPVLAGEQRGGSGVTPHLQRNVARREQQAVLAQRLGQGRGHEQAGEHHSCEQRPDRGRRRVKPVDHPRCADPCPPDDQQQEEGARHAADREVAEDQVGELRDREDVDEVEEQLDGGRRLRRTIVSRAQVAGR
jgi:hypothetical protein